MYRKSGRKGPVRNVKPVNLKKDPFGTRTFKRLATRYKKQGVLKFTPTATG